MLSKLVTFSVLVFTLVAFVPVLHAQTLPSDIPEDIKVLLEKNPATLTDAERQKVLPFLVPSLPPSPEAPADSTNCFDDYSFGSVQVDAAPTLEQTLPGLPLTFSGTIKNANPYPVVNAQVYVKIFKKDQPTEALTKQNGYPLVAFFLAKDNIHINAKSDQPISFDWNVPAYAAGGDYEAAFYFTSAYRYNLLGLSFTDDVTGNKASFAITALDTTATPVTFDKNRVSLNQTTFRFASYPPHFAKDESVTAFATITNPSNTEKTVSVTWITSQWDGILTTNERKRQTEIITLKPNSSKQLAYTPPTLTTSVTFLQAIVKDHDAESILHIRFVRDGVEETRINFPSIASYPLKAGEANALFSCVHSTNLPLVQYNLLTFTLKDDQNKIIERYEYAGDITGAMMGVKHPFTPQATYATFSLTATLQRNGQILEEVTQTYRCAEIDPTLCTEGKNTAAAAVSSAPFIKAAIAIIGGLFLSALLLIWRKRQASKHTGTPLALLFFCLVFSGVFIGGAGEVQAGKSVTWSSSPLPQLNYFWNQAPLYTTDTVPLVTTPVCVGACGWSIALLDANANVTYKAKLVNTATTVEIPDGASVPVGTIFKVLRDTSSLGTDINWFGTGYSGDSPYGRWVAGAGPLPLACHPEDFLGLSLGYSVYILLNVNPPTNAVVSPSSNLSCVGDTCTVTSAGAVSVGLNFSTTQGKFYYRYFSPDPSYLGCHGNNVPMRTGTPLTPYIFGSLTFCTGESCLPATNEYTLPIPTRTIAFNLTAVAGNTNPNPPVVAPQPFSGSPSMSYPFSFTATDPDGNPLRYQIDWNNDGVTDQIVPSSSFIPSGTSQSASNPSSLWTTVGTKTFKARTADNQGGVSGWTTATVTIASGAVNGACGPADTATSGFTSATAPSGGFCSVGTATPVSGSGPWTWTCTGSGGGTTASCQTNPTSPLPQLELCIEDASVLISVASGNGATYSVPSMVIGNTRTFQTFYDATPGDCGPTPVTGTTIWDASLNVPANAVSFASAGVLQADANGSEAVTASYSGQTITLNATVACFPTLTCTADPRSTTVCTGDTFTISDNGCGVPVTCSGTRPCDFNWKEVAP